MTRRLLLLTNPLIAALSLFLITANGSAEEGYQEGFSQSIYMGHSFFQPGARDMEELAPFYGYSRHTQFRQSAGGPNGAPGAIWRDTGEDELGKAEIKKGNVEILGLTAHENDSDYEDYKTWIDFTLEYNAETFDTFFIMIPWIPHSRAGTYAENRATQDLFSAQLNGIIQQLREEYPQLTCLTIPAGEAMVRLWALFDQGQLGPEIHGVYQLNGDANYLQKDPTGHGGHILLDAVGLVWQQTIYPETDIRTVAHPPTYQNDWTYDLRQLAYEIWEDSPYAHRYHEAPPAFATNPVVETAATEGVEYSGATLADDVSDSNEVLKYKNITFASGLAHTDSSTEPSAVPLMLDVYCPDSHSTDRPVLMFIHGGGFKGGSKNQAQIMEMGNYYASRGWVFVSIEYRTLEEMGDIDGKTHEEIVEYYRGISPQAWVESVIDTAESEEEIQTGVAMYAAQRDAKAALRWVVANAAAYNISTDNIAVGGASAGAVTTVALGVSELGDFRDEISLTDDPTLSTTNLNETYDVKSMVYFWGSNLKLELFEVSYGLNRYDSGDPELFMVHGTEDRNPYTPYSEAIELQGIYDDIGVHNELVTLEGKGHAAWGAMVNEKSIYELSFDFLMERQNIQSDDDALTFSKVSGPAWLTVAADGTLSGTPLAADVGPNTFTVSVSDGILAAVEATLEIDVQAAPIDDAIFNAEEILDESTLATVTLQDWHIDAETGTTRQKLVEINVANWWPGQDYRIPVRMIVPLEGKAKGFHITGANSATSLNTDTTPSAFQAELLANGVGIVKTVVKPLAQIPGKQGLEQAMLIEYAKDLNPRYTTIWVWAMTLMRATTAAFAESDYFEPGKVAGSGSSKNGVSPATALINDERFTASCSTVAFAWASPTRKGEPQEIQNVQAANEAFFDAAEAGEFVLSPHQVDWYERVMVGTGPSNEEIAAEAGMPIAEYNELRDRFLASLCVTENWDRLMARGVDVLFQPGTRDYVAYDILWGAQNHPQLPVYYAANAGHLMQPHHAAEADNENVEAFLWNHFFGGEPLLSPPTASHEVIGNELKVQVRFENGPQAESGRIWWVYDRAPAGSAPFLHWAIPDEQWADMEWDSETGSWIATIPLQQGASHIDFFSNHGKEVNGRQHYLSSPYTRVELTGLNTAPAFASDPFSAPDASVDAAYSETIAGAASDADGDPLTYSKVAGDDWLSVAADGSLSGRPNAGDIGVSSITVIVSDGNGGSDQATLEVVVQAANQLPVIDSFERIDLSDTRDMEISITAHDVDGAVTGWLISEDPNPPASDDARWLTYQPTSYTVESPAGVVELYAWVQDDQGAISLPASLLVSFSDPLIFCLSAENTEVSELCFGTHTTATDGFDSGLDVEAPIGRGSRIFWTSNDPEHPYLQTSLQGINPVNRWRLRIAKDPSAAAVVVHWPGFDLEPGKALYLVLLNAEGRPRHEPYDLSQEGRFISRSSGDCEVIYGYIRRGQLELGEGWNFISIPYATPQRIGEIFSGRQAVFQWDGTRYRRQARDRHLLPEHAYLVYSRAATTSEPIRGLPVDGKMVLRADWQTFGPVVSSPVSAGIRAWTFDNATQSYTRADTFEPWKGYWAYLPQRTPLNLGPGETDEFDDFVKQTYVYKNTPLGSMEIDIFYPEVSDFESLPVLVYYHGGGMTSGSKEINKGSLQWDVMVQFMQNGYATASVQYTLANEQAGTSIFDGYTDSKDAIRWLYKHADTLGIDANNIGLIGYSAGGGISQLISMSEASDFVGAPELADYPSGVNYIINLAGGAPQYSEAFDEIDSWDDLTSEQEQDLIENLFKLGASPDDSIGYIKDLLRQASTATYIDPLDPPVATMHGSEDTVVDISAAESLHATLDAEGVNNVFYRLEGYGHGFGTSMPDAERIPYVNALWLFGDGYYE